MIVHVVVVVIAHMVVVTHGVVVAHVIVVTHVVMVVMMENHHGVMMVINDYMTMVVMVMPIVGRRGGAETRHGTNSAEGGQSLECDLHQVSP